MDANLEVKLIECLDALAQGENIEHILARYPAEADQLRPMLQTTAGLPNLRMEPSEANKMKSRQKFLAQAAELRGTAARPRWSFLPRFATGFVAAGLVAIVLSTGVVAASGSALPGDPLYGVKRTVENVRLNTASSPTQRIELQHEFEQRRRDETNELLGAGRESEVEFTGPIESIQPQAWIVGGLVVELNADTTIVGTPQLNRLAEVKGVTGSTGLRASSISIESSGEDDQTPQPEATATPEIKKNTATPESTATPEPTETDTPTGTPQPTRPVASTATPRPTETRRPTATAEPVEIEFTGNVQAIEAATWNIDGTIVQVNANTQLHGNIAVGQRVKVKALRQGNAQLLATDIELISSGGGDNHNQATPEPQPTAAPTDDHGGNQGGATPEPTESHGDHKDSTPEPTKSSGDN